MKLLRLTSENLDGTFDGFLNQEIEIPKKSQMGLQSAVFQTQAESVIIDGSNDEIQFQTSNATGTQSINLQHTDGQATNPENYDENNTQIFFDDMTNKINANLKIINPSQIGKQFLIFNDTNGKVSAQFKTSAFNVRSNELTEGINRTTVNAAPNSPSLLQNAQDILGSASNTNNVAGASQYEFFTHYKFPITKGAGIFRFQLRNFSRVAALSGGFTLALSSRNPHTATTPFAQNDIVAAIQILDMNDANMDGNAPTVALPYSTIVNGGASTPSALNMNAVGGQLGFTRKANPNPFGVGDTRNDHIELAITGNDTTSGTSVCDGANIEMNVYRRTNDTDVPRANPFVKTTLATTAYATHLQRGADLYAYIFIHGGINGANFNIRLQTPRYTADPFIEEQNNNNQPLFLENTVEDIIGEKPAPPKNPNTNHSINFGQATLYEWLGYDIGLQPIQQGKNVSFNALHLFGAKITADAYLVQLLSLKAESYDAHPTKQGRENILTIIPADNVNNRIVYEPNNLLFIDLDNEFPLKISNLRLRIVKQDYSEVPTRGLSSIGLLIK